MLIFVGIETSTSNIDYDELRKRCIQQEAEVSMLNNNKKIILDFFKH